MRTYWAGHPSPVATLHTFVVLGQERGRVYSGYWPKRVFKGLFDIDEIRVVLQ